MPEQPVALMICGGPAVVGRAVDLDDPDLALMDDHQVRLAALARVRSPTGAA